MLSHSTINILPYCTILLISYCTIDMVLYCTIVIVSCFTIVIISCNSTWIINSSNAIPDMIERTLYCNRTHSLTDLLCKKHSKNAAWSYRHKYFNCKTVMIQESNHNIKGKTGQVYELQVAKAILLNSPKI